jgi:Zn-dependent membrane protease YugP
MHPIVILIPAAALILAPRLWVKQVLEKHNGQDDRFALSAAELARELLDRRGLQAVRVEVTDVGDHYDPQERAVRLTRDKQGRKSLTALTTAAHEVAHALQHATHYGPFVWRTRLAKLAQVTGEAGSVLLFAVPVAALVTRNPVPPILIGVAALAMLGTGVAAQVAALPSELDASFIRALPMLRDGYIDADQTQDARRILLACSLTYVASSLVAVLHIWPWIGGGRYPYRRLVAAPGVLSAPFVSAPPHSGRRPIPGPKPVRELRRAGARGGRRREVLVRGILKPLIRGWFRLTSLSA